MECVYKFNTERDRYLVWHRGWDQLGKIVNDKSFKHGRIYRTNVGYCSCDEM